MAVSEEKEARLDVVLGLTPNTTPTGKQNGKTKAADEGYGWETGQWGGWEVSDMLRYSDVNGLR